MGVKRKKVGGYVKEENVEASHVNPPPSHQRRLNECVPSDYFQFARELLTGQYSFQVLVLGILIALLFKTFDWRNYMDSAINKFYPNIQAFNLYSYTRQSVDHAVAIALLLMPFGYFRKEVKKDEEKFSFIEDFISGLNIIDKKTRKAYIGHIDDSWRRLKRQINNLLFRGRKEGKKDKNNVVVYSEAKWLNAVPVEIKKIAELNVDQPERVDIKVRKESLEVLIHNLLAFHILPTISAINMEQLDDATCERISKHLEPQIVKILKSKGKLPHYLNFESPGYQVSRPRRRDEDRRKELQAIFPPRPGRRSRKDTQKMMVMRMLNAKFNAVGAGETTIKELMNFMKEQDSEMSKEELLQHIKQMDEEGKVFYVADDEKLHRIA